MPKENDDTTNSGNIYPTTGRGKLILEFKEEVIEIEDLIKECLATGRVRVNGSEIQTLIQEWKSLYQRKVGEDISVDGFNKTEIGIFILNHSLYENMEKML